jgi:GT2 family glycosyltransferase
MFPDARADTVSIIIPAFNQLEYCRACLAALSRHTSRPHKLILVDNGSTDGVGSFFDSVYDAIVLHARQNLGFAGGVNLALTEAEGHVVLLNSDTLVTPDWLERLERALTSAADIGLAGPLSNCAADTQQIDGLDLPNEISVDAFALELAQRNDGMVREVARLSGFCLMIRDGVWQDVGLFDERFAIGNFEDNDYCTRVRMAGRRVVVAEDAFVFHYGGKTFASMGYIGSSYDLLLEENRRRYHEKWNLRAPVAQSGEARAQQLSMQAREAFETGRLPQAMRLLREAIGLAPGEACHYNDLGVVVWRLGKAEMAYNLFIRALRHDREYEEARENAEHVADELGCRQEFWEWYEDLLHEIR